jgi:phage baseplate assembly protein W
MTLDNSLPKRQYDPFFNPEQTQLEYSQETDPNAIMGFAFPLERNNPRGFFYRVTNTQAVKADLIQLLMTEPGERTMMPKYGTGLRKVFFEARDNLTNDQVSQIVANAISNWEPRIVVQSISVKFSDGDSRVNRETDGLGIIVSISFALKDDLTNIEQLDFAANFSPANV